MKHLSLSDLFAKRASLNRNHRRDKWRHKRPFSGRFWVEALENRLALTTFTVNTLADTIDTDPAVTSLRDAIRAANIQGGDNTLHFSVTGIINLTGPLPDLSSNIQIDGPGAGNLTVRRDTGGDYRIFTVDTGAIVGVDDLTISNGFLAAGGGGGIGNEGGNLTVSNSTVSDNHTQNGGGGGIDNEVGTLIVSNSTLRGNSGSNPNYGGGGISNYLGTLTVSNSTLSYNVAGQGGGISNIAGTVTVSNSTLSSSTIATPKGGGGIYSLGMLTISNSTLSDNSNSEFNYDAEGGGILNGGTATITNSTLSGNSVTYGFGGGIMNYGELTVSNSTLSGNSADWGGGMFSLGTSTVTNSTLFGNVADSGGGGGDGFGGGGIYLDGEIGGTLTVSNSTLSRNSGGGIYHDGRGMQTISNSIVANSLAGGDVIGPFTGSNNLFGNVPLGPLQDNGGPTQTQALPAGSPAIDAGDNALVPTGVTTGQRGFPFLRVAGTNVDIGAFETQPPALPVLGTQGDDTIIIGTGTQPGTFKTTVDGVVTDNIAVDGGVFVSGLGGNDSITITAAPAGGLVMDGGDGSDTYDVSLGNLAGTVVVAGNGASGTSQLTVHGTAGDDYIYKDDTQVTLGNPVQETVLYSGIQSLTIHGEAGNDTIVDPGGNTQIYGDAGNDTIIINATSSAGVFLDGGTGSDTYVIGGGNLAGPVTIADSGTTGTDGIQIVGTSASDAIVQTTTGFLLNGTTITISGVKTASVDGGGGTFSVQGTPGIPVTVQGVADTIVYGTPGDDTIRLVATSNPGEAKAYVNGALVGTFRPTGHVIVYGLAGNDNISADGVNVPVVLYGGDGNDTLTGGSADDIIFGGAGDDMISGGAGNDFLIGGAGKDRIVGGAGNDILVAGDIGPALDLATLQAICQAWAASRSVYDDTVDDVLDETLGDTSTDQLTGGAGADLFIINSGDKITDFQFGKPKTNKDGDVVIEDGVAVT